MERLGLPPAAMVGVPAAISIQGDQGSPSIVDRIKLKRSGPFDPSDQIQSSIMVDTHSNLTDGRLGSSSSEGAGRKKRRMFWTKEELEIDSEEEEVIRRPSRKVITRERGIERGSAGWEKKLRQGWPRRGSGMVRAHAGGKGQEKENGKRKEDKKPFTFSKALPLPTDEIIPPRSIQRIYLDMQKGQGNPSSISTSSRNTAASETHMDITTPSPGIPIPARNQPIIESEAYHHPSHARSQEERSFSPHLGSSSPAFTGSSASDRMQIESDTRMAVDRTRTRTSTTSPHTPLGRTVQQYKNPLLKLQAAEEESPEDRERRNTSWTLNPFDDDRVKGGVVVSSQLKTSAKAKNGKERERDAAEGGGHDEGNEGDDGSEWKRLLNLRNRYRDRDPDPECERDSPTVNPDPCSFDSRDQDRGQGSLQESPTPPCTSQDRFLRPRTRIFECANAATATSETTTALQGSSSFGPMRRNVSPGLEPGGTGSVGSVRRSSMPIRSDQSYTGYQNQIRDHDTARDGRNGSQLSFQELLGGAVAVDCEGSAIDPVVRRTLSGLPAVRSREKRQRHRSGGNMRSRSMSVNGIGASRLIAIPNSSRSDATATAAVISSSLPISEQALHTSDGLYMDVDGDIDMLASSQISSSQVSLASTQMSNSSSSTGTSSSRTQNARFRSPSLLDFLTERAEINRNLYLRGTQTSSTRRESQPSVSSSQSSTSIFSRSALAVIKREELMERSNPMYVGGEASRYQDSGRDRSMRNPNSAELQRTMDLGSDENRDPREARAGGGRTHIGIRPLRSGYLIRANSERAPESSNHADQHAHETTADGGDIYPGTPRPQAADLNPSPSRTPADSEEDDPTLALHFRDLDLEGDQLTLDQGLGLLGLEDESPVRGGGGSSSSTTSQVEDDTSDRSLVMSQRGLPDHEEEEGDDDQDEPMQTSSSSERHSPDEPPRHVLRSGKQYQGLSRDEVHDRSKMRGTSVMKQTRYSTKTKQLKKAKNQTRSTTQTRSNAARDDTAGRAGGMNMDNNDLSEMHRETGQEDEDMDC